jgi:alkanesulfonate monooxygenase SsuD/methylene tetrahydromethanopterin reductase-like flavin-dependent oxidoreductase (luciferase family)
VLLFGIIRNFILPWDQIVEQWLRFEAAGFDSIWGIDHFQRPTDPSDPLLESWTGLAALAALTTRARIGILVSSNTFRSPALLAKEAVTVDHISGGRLELGIGAGGFEREHETWGIDYPEPRERVDRLIEAIELIDLLMRNDVVTFEGKHYRVDNAPFRPGPIQKPRPPLTLGAHGPRMLTVVARYADRWNSYGTVDEMRDRNQTIDCACAAIGRDPHSIIRSLYARPQAIGFDPWSSVEAFHDLVARYRVAGVDEFILEPPRDGQWATMDRIAAQDIPRLREADLA